MQNSHAARGSERRNLASQDANLHLTLVRTNHLGDSVADEISTRVKTARKNLVRMRGLEPPRVSPLPPQSSVSTSSTTSAPKPVAIASSDRSFIHRISRGFDSKPLRLRRRRSVLIRILRGSFDRLRCSIWRRIRQRRRRVRSLVRRRLYAIDHAARRFDRAPAHVGKCEARCNEQGRERCRHSR